MHTTLFLLRSSFTGSIYKNIFLSATSQESRSHPFNSNHCFLNPLFLSRLQSNHSTSPNDNSSALYRKLNCDLYVLNPDGSLENHPGPFDRAHICQTYGLEPRDLQKIDTDIFINVPIIDVRQGRFICFSFRRLRSLVQYNRSIFFAPLTGKVDTTRNFGVKDSAHWERITEAYHQNIKYVHQLYNQRYDPRALIDINSIPFEFRIVEINLEAVYNGLMTKANDLLAEFKIVRERAYTRITIGSLRELALLKEKIDKYKRNADLAHQAILDVLAQDEDMVGMYLTDKRRRDLSDHMQIELLLEACTKQMAEARRSISDLSDSVHTLESATGFMLDAVRNELIGFEIRINIITMGLAIGALIAGICGMNLSHGFEQAPYSFYIIPGATCCFMTGSMVVAIIKLRRYNKIRLSRSNKAAIR